MSNPLAKISAVAWGQAPHYKGWKVKFLKDEKTIQITKGKESHEFKGQSVTLEYNQGEAIAEAYKFIARQEQEVASDETQDFTLLAIMVAQAVGQAKVIENKFTKMDKHMLNKFFNGCKGLTQGLEMRMDNSEEFGEQTYMILEFMEKVNKIALAALLDGRGDQFEQLMDVWKNTDWDEIEKKKESS